MITNANIMLNQHIEKCYDKCKSKGTNRTKEDLIKDVYNELTDLAYDFFAFRPEYSYLNYMQKHTEDYIINKIRERVKQ